MSKQIDKVVALNGDSSKGVSIGCFHLVSIVSTGSCLTLIPTTSGHWPNSESSDG